MQMKDKVFFSIPLMSIWYVIFTLILILMQSLGIINCTALELTAPLWVPTSLALIIIVVVYSFLGLILGIVYVLNWIIERIRKNKRKRY